MGEAGGDVGRAGVRAMYLAAPAYLVVSGSVEAGPEAAWLTLTSRHYLAISRTRVTVLRLKQTVREHWVWVPGYLPGKMAQLVTQHSRTAHQAAAQARSASHKRLKEALKKHSAGSLNESAGTALRAQIVAETIVLERAQLLEAAGPDVAEQLESYGAMLSALEDAAHNLRSGTLARAVDKLSALAPADAQVVAGDPRSLRAFQKALADAAVLTKGLLALSRAIDDQSTGLGQTFHKAMAEVQPSDRLDFALGFLAAPGAERKRGILQKLTGTGGNPKERFGRELKKVLSAAAGFDRQVDAEQLVKDVLFSPVGRLLGTLRNFDSAVSEQVSPAMLVQMSKTSLLGAIKGMFDVGGGSSGGAGSRLGGSRALAPGKAPSPALAGPTEGPFRALCFFLSRRCNSRSPVVEWLYQVGSDPRRFPTHSERSEHP